MEIKKRFILLPIFRGMVEDIIIVTLFLYMYYTNKSHGDEVSVMLFSWVNLMLVGYFLLRFLFQVGGRIAHELIILVIEIAAVYESFLGILQIVGVVGLNNSLFPCTGTFDNPGPLGGFLAVSLCVSLAEVFALTQKKGVRLFSILDKLILVTSLISVILCVVILPSTQSRAAWLSIMISATFYCLNSTKTLVWIKAHWLLILSIIFVLLSFVLIFKLPSTKGRLITYKMELMTIKRNCFKGVGLGHFSSAYGETQRDYFSKTISIQDGELRYKKSDKERIFVDNPKVGFNDYLQIGIEFGVGPLILFLLLVVLIMYQLFKLYSPFFYGMISMLVFAFFSYPFSLWEFLVIFLVFAAFAGYKCDAIGFPKMGSLFFAFSCIFPLVFFYKSIDTVRTMHNTEQLWKQQRFFFDSTDYQSYGYCCSQLYSNMRFNCAFLYEYAYSLYKGGDVVESEKTIRQSLALSGNALSFILLGDIHKMQGLIEDAERDYFNSFLALPDRLYPLYKLAILYHDSNQKVKYHKMVRSIENFHPRIESQSTKEIRVMLAELKLADEQSK